MDGRCASCKHWEYADYYEPEWESLPLTHLFAWGECAQLSDPAGEVEPVRSSCEHQAEPTLFDTHWTFGCVRYERRAS